VPELQGIEAAIPDGISDDRGALHIFALLMDAMSRWAPDVHGTRIHLPHKTQQFQPSCPTAAFVSGRCLPSTHKSRTPNPTNPYRPLSAQMDSDDDGNASQTRRERRKQSKYFKLRQPDRSGPKGKTLLEIAEEREKNLFKLADERRAELAQGTAPPGAAADLDEPIGRFGEAVVYTITMAMLHFTLDVLVYNQYGKEINWAAIFSRTAQSIPGPLLPSPFLSCYSVPHRLDVEGEWTTDISFIIYSNPCFGLRPTPPGRSGNHTGFLLRSVYALWLLPYPCHQRMGVSCGYETGITARNSVGLECCRAAAITCPAQLVFGRGIPPVGQLFCLLGHLGATQYCKLNLYCTLGNGMYVSSLCAPVRKESVRDYCQVNANNRENVAHCDAIQDWRP
jgi:hypothetical protein